MKARTILNCTFTFKSGIVLDAFYPTGKTTEEAEKVVRGDSNTDITINGSLKTLIEFLEGYSKDKVRLENQNISGVYFHHLADDGIYIEWSDTVSRRGSVIKPDEVCKFKELVENQERIRELFRGLRHITW